jgi:hypothetical protein
MLRPAGIGGLEDLVAEFPGQPRPVGHLDPHGLELGLGLADAGHADALRGGLRLARDLAGHHSHSEALMLAGLGAHALGHFGGRMGGGFGGLGRSGSLGRRRLSGGLAGLLVGLGHRLGGLTRLGRARRGLLGGLGKRLAHVRQGLGGLAEGLGGVHLLRDRTAGLLVGHRLLGLVLGLGGLAEVVHGLLGGLRGAALGRHLGGLLLELADFLAKLLRLGLDALLGDLLEIGRASCRERV